jgi:hypothetical protein
MIFGKRGYGKSAPAFRIMRRQSRGQMRIVGGGDGLA